MSGKTSTPIEFRVNGIHLTEIGGGEVAITNMNSCYGPEFTLQLHFSYSDDASSPSCQKHVAWEILGRIKRTMDKNSVSLTCKRLHELDSQQRNSIRVGCGLDPTNDALISLCNTFQNLEKVEISYSGWMSRLGKQLNDQGLQILSNNYLSWRS